MWLDKIRLRFRIMGDDMGNLYLKNDHNLFTQQKQ